MVDENLIISELLDLAKKTSRLEVKMYSLEKALEDTCNQMREIQKEINEANHLMGKITQHLEANTCNIPSITQIAGNVEGDVAGENVINSDDAVSKKKSE